MISAIDRGFSNGTREATTGQLSILIVNWNVRDLLRDCLRSLKEDRVQDLGEVIVVDNDSRDGSAAMVRAEFPWVRLIESGANLGFSRANNLGLNTCRNEWLFLLNPDTVLPPGTLTRLLEFAESKPRAGIIAPLQRDRSGAIQFEAAVALPTIWNVLCDFTLLSVLFPRNRHFNGRKLGDWDHTGSREVPAVCGAAMLVRPEVWRKIGNIDETMFCIEDMDYCLRVREAGWKIWYTDVAPILHVGRSSITQHNQGWQMQVILQSFWLYRRKHFGTLASCRVSLGIFAWAISAIGLLAPIAWLLPQNSRFGQRLRQVVRMAGPLFSWSVRNKWRFSHPLAAAPRKERV